MSSRPSATELAMLDWLDSEGVYNNRCGRRTFYAWTSPEQVKEIRAHSQVLTRAESTSERSLYQAELEASTEPIAKLLRDPVYGKRRFAWTNPWATSRGHSGGSSGTELLRITIRAGGLIVAMNVGSDVPFRVFQVDDGVEVGTELALQQPYRIAAIYHVATAPRPGSPDALPFREFVLVNESFVERLVAASKEMAGDLEVDVEMLKTVKAAIARARSSPTAPERTNDLHAWATDVSSRVWTKYPGPTQDIGPAERLAQRYSAALAFLTEAYSLEEANIDAEIQAETGAIEAIANEQPLEVSAYRPFGTLLPASVPPKLAPPRPTLSQ